MVQQVFKNIVVHEETYDELRKMGDVTESFNDVIWKLIQKAADGHGSLEGPLGQAAGATRNDPEATTDK